MRNRSIDLLKFICATFVVLLHMGLTNTVGECIVVLTRCAVPIFFMCSGYFSYKAIVTEDAQRLKKRIPKLLRLYIFGECFYFCTHIVSGIVLDKQTLAVNLSEVFNSKNFLEWIFFGQDLTSGHLWFLISLIEIYAFMCLCIKVFKSKTQKIIPFMSLLLVPVLFLIRFLPYNSSFIISSLCWTRNFVFTGLPFFALGYICRLKPFKKGKTILIISAVLSYIVAVFEKMIIKSTEINCDLSVGITVFSVCIFVLFTKLDLSKIKENVFLKHIDSATMYIYVYHLIILSATKTLLEIVGITSQVALAFATIILSYLFAFFLSFFLEKIKLNFSKKR